MIRKMMSRKVKDGSNIFASTNIFKRAFTLGIFISSFILVLILLFRLSDATNTFTSFTSDSSRDFATTFIFISFVWFGTIKIIRNFKTAFKDLIISYIFATAGVVYMYVVTIYEIQYSFSEWAELPSRIVYMAPFLIGISAWQLLKGIVEIKVRPYYSRRSFIKAILYLFDAYILYVVYWLVNKFFVKQEDFDYLAPYTFAILISIGIVVCMYIILVIWSLRYERYFEAEWASDRVVHFMAKLLYVGPIIIWSAFSISFSQFEYQHWLYLGANIILIGAFTYSVLAKDEVGGQSQTYRLTSIFTIFAITLLNFVFSETTSANRNMYIIVWLVSIVYVFVMDVLITPKISYVNKVIEKIYMFFTLIHAIMILVLGKISNIDIQSLPFEIDTIIFVFPLGLISLEMLITTVGFWDTLHTISKFSGKIVKHGKKKKKSVRSKKKETVEVTYE